MLQRARAFTIPAAALALLLVAWRWRALQVISFSIASLMYRLLPSRTMLSPASTLSEWASQQPLSERRPMSRARGVMTYHPWYQDFRAAPVNECLSEISILGAGCIRTDVRWGDVLPDGVTPDERAMAWYRTYFQAARDWYGLRPLIVLSQPPLAVTRLDSHSDTFMERWAAYVELVSARLGDLCDLFQPLNEPNNPVYNFFPSERQAQALSVAAGLIRRHAPGARIMVNVLMDLWNWEDTIGRLLTSAGDNIDIIGIDHYPGTWTFSDTSDWLAFTKLASDVAASGHLWAGKSLALVETGFATNSSWLRSPDDQSAYFAQVASIIKKVEALPGTVPLSMIGMYELVDMDSNAFLDPERHFGLLTSDLRRKPAYDVVRRLFESL